MFFIEKCWQLCQQEEIFSVLLLFSDASFSQYSWRLGKILGQMLGKWFDVLIIPFQLQEEPFLQSFFFRIKCLGKKKKKNSNTLDGRHFIGKKKSTTNNWMLKCFLSNESKYFGKKLDLLNNIHQCEPPRHLLALQNRALIYKITMKTLKFL